MKTFNYLRPTEIFAHAFEAFIHKNTPPYVELMANESIRLI